jgi:uncharacterized protein (TIGR03086 family)
VTDVDVMSRLAYLDATALALIGHDVTRIDDAELTNPTPCEDWTVRDLVRHMNVEHESVIAGVLPRRYEPVNDPRTDFAYTAARWVVALEQAGQAVTVPKVGRVVPVERVLSIHFVDMLVHRWDLAEALGRECVVPGVLTGAAAPIATAITRPGSPLVGPGGEYHFPLPDNLAQSSIDRIAARLGRDLQWNSRRLQR